MYPKAFVLLSFLSLVHCCPYIVGPSSLNVSQGKTARFSVIVCRNLVAPIVIWTVNNFKYINGNNFNGVSVVQQNLNGNRARSNLFLSTNSRNFDKAFITSTVSAVTSHTVFLRIQGLLDVVNDLNFDRTNQQLSWTPPFTLSGVPISHYRISINSDSNINNSPVFITNSTTLYLNGTPCQNYSAIIRAVNAVGEGQAASLKYTHAGAPDVYYENYTGTIKNDTFAIEVFYEISYNCTEQIPVKVHAVTRNVYGNSVIHSNQSVIRAGMLTGNVLSGSYSIDELPSDDIYIGQLVFETEQGLTVKTREFKLWTFDLKSVTITSNEFEVCVSVSYTSGSEAIGFVIKTLTGQWNITRNYNNNNNTACLSLTNGVHQVRVFDWNSDGSVPEKWRKEMNVSIAVSHKSHSSLYATSHISSARTKTTSQISTVSITSGVSSASLSVSSIASSLAVDGVSFTKRLASLHSTSANGVSKTTTAHTSSISHYSSTTHSAVISNAVPTTTNTANGFSTISIISGAVGMILLIIIMTIITLLIILAIKKQKGNNKVEATIYSTDAATHTYEEIIDKPTTAVPVPIYDTPMETDINVHANAAYQKLKVNKDIIDVHNNAAYGQL